MAQNPASDNLFIGDIPAALSQNDVSSVFAAYGTVVSVKINAPNGPKGSCLVRFGSVDEATWIVENLNGNIPEGLSEPVVVRFANQGGLKPWERAAGQTAGGAPAWGGQTTGGCQNPPSDNLFVGDIPAQLSQNDITQVFAAYGTVVSVRVNAASGDKGSCLVKFATLDEAKWVCENLNGNIPEGLDTPVVVRYANKPGANKADGKGNQMSNGGGVVAPPTFVVKPAVAQPNDRIFVGDLPNWLNEQTTSQIFSSYGTVSNCKMLPEANGKLSAIVQLASAEEAKWIVDNLNGNIAEGLEEPIVVRYEGGVAPPSGKGPAKAGGKGPYNGGGGGNDWGGNDWGGGGGKDFGGKGGQDWAGGGGKGGGKGKGAGSVQILHNAALKGGIYGPKVHIPPECQLYLRNLPPDTTDLDLYKLIAPFGAVKAVKAMLNPDGSCTGIGFVDLADESCASAAVTTLDNFATPDGGILNVSLKVKKQ